MRKTLLALCVLFVLTSCQPLQDAQQQLQQQAEQKIRDEANKAKDSIFDSIGQTIDSWTKPIRDWWGGIWGSQPAPNPDPQPNPNPNPNPSPNSSTYVVGSNGARGRECPKLTCNIITTFKPGQKIQVSGTKEGDLYGSSTTWLIVSYNDSTVFVHSSLASPEAPLADVPADALLPFEGTNNYTGGPHVANDTTACNEKELDVTDGIDFSTAGSNKNFEVLAIAGGEVLEAHEWDKKTFGKGTFVTIKHSNGLISEYWHLSRISDEIKELMKGKDHTVVQGFPLGFAGDSGNQKAVHLHLRISRGWHGQSIDGWTIWMHLKPGSNSTGFNYQGSATKGKTKEHEITLSASACGGGKANATVGENFTGTEEKNGVDANTLFAEDRSSVPQAPMASDNHRRTN